VVALLAPAEDKLLSAGVDSLCADTPRTDRSQENMPNKTINVSPVTGFMRQFSLSIQRPFFKKPDQSQTRSQQITWSDFSKPDESELLAREEEISPLVEAEVYLIYGRKADAVKALQTGVKSRRITADEVAQFWANQGNPAGQVSSD
jgi:hypothetical protein